MKTLFNQGYQLAYHASEGRSPCVIFCGGFHSSMQGIKALALEKYCQTIGQAYVRFDYFAHGDSEGDFADGSISTWLSDTLSIIDAVADGIVDNGVGEVAGKSANGEVVLVGSSMGGWLALLAAIERPERVKGLVLLACAADMTQYYPKRVEGLQQERDGQGRIFYSVPNQYDDKVPYKIYKQLIDDGRRHFLLGRKSKPIALDMPVHLIHGKQDDVVPWQRSQQVHELLGVNNREHHHLHIVEQGDHRLSREEDIELLFSVLDSCLH